MKFQCCDADEIAVMAGEIVAKRGGVFSSSVFQCVKCVTMLRKDAFGEARSEARVGMLRDVAEIISDMAKVRPCVRVLSSQLHGHF